jgi:hypothetical protein
MSIAQESDSERTELVSFGSFALSFCDSGHVPALTKIGHIATGSAL